MDAFFLCHFSSSPFALRDAQCFVLELSALRLFLFLEGSELYRQLVAVAPL